MGYESFGEINGIDLAVGDFVVASVAVRFV